MEIVKISRKDIQMNTGFGISELQCPNCKNMIQVSKYTLNRFCEKCGAKWIEIKGE